MTANRLQNSTLEADLAEPKRLLIVGCGYVGLRVARLAKRAGQRVYALTRSTERFAELESAGISPIDGHWLRRGVLADPSAGGLPAVDWVLVAVPHREEDSLGEQTHCVGLENLVAALPSSLSRLVYLSTTGVYGSCGGEVVDETTAVSPTRIGPKIAVAAEAWLASHLPPPVHTTLRLAGIYGPDRVPLAARLRAGEPLAVPRHGHLNLVHVDDIAAMILAVAATKLRLASYVFSDAQPVQRVTFYTHLAELCGLDKPVFVEPEPGDPRVRRATDKRVSPAQLMAETQLQLAYPSYREGLASLVK